jgi:hypothetical protein
LKGSGGSYGFDAITALAAAERRLDAHGTVDDLLRGVTGLIALIRRVDGYDLTREAAAC